MLNIAQRLARANERNDTALNRIYNAVSARALEIVLNPSHYDGDTCEYARDLLDAISRIKRGAGSAQDHGRVARAYSAMRQGGLAD